MENKLPNTLVTNDRIPAFQAIGHIVNHVDKDHNQVEDGEDCAPHGFPMLKGGCSHAQGGDLQADVAKNIADIVDFCRDGFHVFNVGEAEKSRNYAAEDAVSKGGVQCDLMQQDIALYVVQQHDGTQNKNRAEDQAP